MRRYSTPVWVTIQSATDRFTSRHYAASSRSSRLCVHVASVASVDGSGRAHGGLDTRTPHTRSECEEQERSLERAARRCYPLRQRAIEAGRRALVQALAPRPVRVPLECRPSLSHVGQTLESGVPALPRATSLDAAGQWPVCGAGTSPTEIPQMRESPGTPRVRSRVPNGGSLGRAGGRVK